MRRTLLILLLLAVSAAPAAAETAEAIVAKYVEAVGGMERIQAVKTLRRSGRFVGNGGFEAVVAQENERPNRVREEFTMQGLTGVNAYDGRTGWKIEPWDGKRDAEPLGEEEMKSILEDSDFDGPLVDFAKKKNRVELIGTGDVEGTDVLKLKVTLANGDVHTYFLDAEYYVPIKIEVKRKVRGADREYETLLGDYKKVNGWYLPYSYQTSRKGSSQKQQIVYEKIEANVEIEASRFQKPGAPTSERMP